MNLSKFDEHYYIIKEIEFNCNFANYIHNYGMPIKSNLFPIIKKEDFNHNFKNNVNIYTLVNTKKPKNKYYSTRILSTTKLNKRKRELYKLKQKNVK